MKTNKIINYILSHFRIQPSHPEESEKGWEVRWTFFNIAFLRKKKDEHKPVVQSKT